MNSEEFNEAYRKLRIAKQKSQIFHAAWCAIMDAFVDFLDEDMSGDRAAAIADIYARKIVDNHPGVEK